MRSENGIKCRGTYDRSQQSNLKDFSVDTGNSRRFRKLIPPDVLFVSESGVSSAEDVRKLCEIGADAVLIGETLMRAENKAARLAELRGVL